MPFSDRPVSSATLSGPASSQHEGVLGWHEWVAPFLSLCCFVHCVGMAVLAPLLPTALAFLGVNEQYDWTLWSMSAISVSFSLWVQRLQVTTWLMAVWGAGIVASLVSLTRGQELIHQFSLAGLVGVQFWMVHRKWRVHQETCLTSDTGTAGCMRED
jgi:hypothetical protein